MTVYDHALCLYVPEQIRIFSCSPIFEADVTDSGNVSTM